MITDEYYGTCHPPRCASTRGTPSDPPPFQGERSGPGLPRFSVADNLTLKVSSKIGSDVLKLSFSESITYGQRGSQVTHLHPSVTNDCLYNEGFCAIRNAQFGV